MNTTPVATQPSPTDAIGLDPTSSIRWTCPNHASPVMLGMVDDLGNVNIKVRDRVWQIRDCATVTAVCPKCGMQHTRYNTGH